MSRQAYDPGPRRLQLAPRSCSFEMPCRRASSRLKGPWVSAAGTTGTRAISHRSLPVALISSTQAVKTANCAVSVLSSARFPTLTARSGRPIEAGLNRDAFERLGVLVAGLLADVAVSLAHEFLEIPFAAGLGDLALVLLQGIDLA